MTRLLIYGHRATQLLETLCSEAAPEHHCRGEFEMPAKRASMHCSPARFIARTLPGTKPAPSPGFVEP